MSWHINLRAFWLFLVCLGIQKVAAHMELLTPFPMHSQYDPAVPVADKDYNLKSPLNADGSNFPCRGYQNERPITTKAAYTAGSTYNMQIAGTINHNGGSCQISLSYDNGATFKVIQSMIGNCPIQTSYDFTVPTYAPAGQAILSWTWFNEVGNREMYQTCAWVQIQASSQKRRNLNRRTTYNSMQSLPNIWRANIAGLSTCNTTEPIDPHFANLGPAVVWGPGKSANDPVTLPNGNCDSPTPYGQLFQQANDMMAPGSFQSSNPAASNTSAASSIAASPSSASPISMSIPTGTVASSAAFSAVSSTLSGTVTTLTTTLTTIIAASQTSLPTSTLASAPTTLGTFISSTVPSSTLAAASSFASPAAVSSSPSASSPSASFASLSDINSYIPCVPGTYLCISSTQFMICDNKYIGSVLPSQQYTGPLDVAGGLQCVPFLARIPTAFQLITNGSTTSLAYNTPSGYFRSDRYL